MGAFGVGTSLPGTYSRQQVEEWFRRESERAAYEDGHSYSGSWNMLNGLVFDYRHFDSEREANEYVSDHTDKWGSGLAVRYTHRARHVERKPTFAGSEATNVFGNDPFPVWTWKYGKGTRTLHPADQLTDAQKERVVKAAQAHEASGRTLRQAQDTLRTLADGVKDLNATFDADAIRRARTALGKAETAHVKTTEALRKVEESVRDRLYFIRETTEERWWVGGWAAS